MLSPRRKTLAIAVGVFLVLGFLAIYASPMSAFNLQDRLKVRAEAALTQANVADWAEVSMRGQVAILSGLAPNQTEQARALEAVSMSSWVGGVVSGGITRVIDETRLETEGDGFALTGQLANGRATIEGFAPDDETRARIDALAEMLFAGRARVHLQLAPGLAPEMWEEGVRILLTELSRLDSGSIVLDGDVMALHGLADTMQTSTAVRGVFSALPNGLRGTALVRAPGENPALRVQDIEVCAALVRAVRRERDLLFLPGEAGISDMSRPVVRAMGEAFSHCDGARLIVRVRGDQRGENGEGEALALARAEAVITIIANGGVDAERLSAAPGDPSQHRLVEFDIRSEEE
ncbi:glycosyltransferase family protein [Woodsholea maritima]|uniref:hypothetical protein n=1 Tax=Woodsholea maritima TaxID=240237 RepID=UPI0003768229|nr:hypothetical protein [Woodsholea maritima]